VKRKTSALVLVVFLVALVAGQIGCATKSATDMSERQRAKEMVKAAKKMERADRLGGKGIRHLRDAEKYVKDGDKAFDRRDYASAANLYKKAWREADRAMRNLKCETPKIPDPVVVTVEPEYKLHCVAKGESLWWIASYEEYYGDPFSWPLIYAENKCEIDWEAQRHGMPKMKVDGYAHWIFPGQVLRINMTPYIEDWIWARDLAGAPCPCDLPIDCGCASIFPIISYDTPEESLYYLDMLLDLDLISQQEYDDSVKQLEQAENISF